MSENQTQENLINCQQVADFLGITTRSVRKQMRAGKIPYFKIGRTVRFRLSDVKAKIESNCSVNTGTAIQLPPRPPRRSRG